MMESVGSATDPPPIDLPRIDSALLARFRMSDHLTIWLTCRRSCNATEPKNYLTGKVSPHPRAEGGQVQPAWAAFCLSGIFAYDNSINTSGFCSAIRNNASAGPLGFRRPCSQS